MSFGTVRLTSEVSGLRRSQGRCPSRRWFVHPPSQLMSGIQRQQGEWVLRMEKYISSEWFSSSSLLVGSIEATLVDSSAPSDFVLAQPLVDQYPSIKNKLAQTVSNRWKGARGYRRSIPSPDILATRPLQLLKRATVARNRAVNSSQKATAPAKSL